MTYWCHNSLDIILHITNKLYVVSLICCYIWEGYTIVLRGIATINIFASEHEEAKKWYADLLGIEPYFERPGYIEFRIGDYQQELGIIDSRFLSTQVNPGPVGAVVYWHVDDVCLTNERLLSKGAKQLEAPRDRGNGFTTALVADPFGNILGIMYNPHYQKVLESFQG